MKEKGIRNKSYSKAQALSQTSSAAAGLRDAAPALSRHQEQRKKRSLKCPNVLVYMHLIIENTYELTMSGKLKFEE